MIFADVRLRGVMDGIDLTRGEDALAAGSCDPRFGTCARARRRTPARCRLHAQVVAATQRADRRRTALASRVGCPCLRSFAPSHCRDHAFLPSRDSKFVARVALLYTGHGQFETIGSMCWSWRRLRHVTDAVCNPDVDLLGFAHQSRSFDVVVQRDNESGRGAGEATRHHQDGIDRQF